MPRPPSTGATLQLDGPGRAKYWPDSTILQLIADLVERGHADRLLLGGDTGRRGMMRAYGGGPGLDYVFARFRPRLERELGAASSEQIFVANPARAFAWDPRLPNRLDSYTVAHMDGPFSLAGRRVVVTGASSGIGEAVAAASPPPGARRRHLARRGAPVDGIFSTGDTGDRTRSSARRPRRGRMGRHRRLGQQRRAPDGEAARRDDGRGLARPAAREPARLLLRCRAAAHGG